MKINVCLTNGMWASYSSLASGSVNEPDFEDLKNMVKNKCLEMWNLSVSILCGQAIVGQAHFSTESWTSMFWSSCQLNACPITTGLQIHLKTQENGAFAKR